MQSNQILVVAAVVLALVAVVSAQGIATATGSGITAASINTGGGVVLTTTRGAFIFRLTMVEEYNATNPTVALRSASIPLTTIFTPTAVVDLSTFGVLGSQFTLAAANINLVGGSNTTNSSTIVNYAATVFRNDTAISAGASVVAPPGVAATAQSNFKITNGSAIVQVGLTTFNSVFGNGNSNIRLTVTVTPSTGSSSTSGTVTMFSAANANVAPAKSVAQGLLLNTAVNAGLSLNAGNNGVATYTVTFPATNANNQAYFFFGAGQNNFNGGAASLLSSVFIDSVKALF